ncbi:MAG: dynamin family protein [Actinomycetota bacterium]
MSLIDETRSVLTEARDALAGSPAGTEIEVLLDRLNGPLRVAIAGRVKAGKSTLLNALVGSHLAPTDARECTRIVTWYRNGQTYGATALLRTGASESLAFEFADDEFAVSLGDLAIDDIHALHVFWPSRELEATTLIDTPGVGSMTPDAAARSHEFLGGGGQEAEADAVLYLMKHLHGTDLDLLSAFHDEEVSHPNPVNAIGVLSRADEVGSGRADAMDSAATVAARIANEPPVRRLVSTVVPVCGLLAETAATLREREYRLLAAVAALPTDERRIGLLSADRFRTLDGVPGLEPADRESLLGRFAMFGLRASIAAIGGGAAPSSTDLARLLTRLSGIENVRRLLDTVFAERGDVLKARSALVSLGAALDRAGNHPAVADLERRLEQVLASAHEIAELRALGTLRLDAVPAEGDILAEAERLVGGSGRAPARRLGMLDTSQHDQLLAEAQRKLGEWQRRAEHPLSGADLVSLCRVVIRSCEGMISSLLSEPASPTTF